MKKKYKLTIVISSFSLKIKTQDNDNFINMNEIFLS